jgi:phage terminase large subunit
MNLEIPTPRWAEKYYYPKGHKKYGQRIPSRYKGAYGGRGSGKSHEFAGAVVDVALDGKSIVCVREHQKSLKFSAKRLIEGKIKSFGVEKSFGVQKELIKCPNDGIIIFVGMQDYNAENIQSLEDFDICWIEQAEKLSQTSLDLLRPTIRNENSEIWATWNPKEESDPIDAFLRKECPGDAIVLEANYPDNPWFPEVLQQEMEYDKKHDYEKYLHVWKGKYKQQSDAIVFKNWREEEFEVPEDVIHRLGADFGYSRDPSTLVDSYIVGKKLYIPYEAYEIGCEIDNLPLLYQQVPDSEKWPIVADSARPDTINYLRRKGFKIYAAAKGPGSIEDGIEFLKNYEIIVHPRCTHTITELENYKYKTVPKYDPKQGKVVDEVTNILEDKNNHVIDALRYANEGFRRSKPVVTRTVTYQPEAYY